jgi:hypothetical protein
MAARETTMTSIAEQHIESAYVKFRAHGGNSRFEAEGLTGKEIVATLLGNLNYQTENGGLFQWWDNRYAFEEGPNGTTAHVAIAALASRFRDLDPMVADHILEAMTFINPVPELDRKGKEAGGSLRWLDGDDDDGDEYHEDPTPLQEHFSGKDITTRYCGVDQDRRLAFIDKVVEAYPDDGNPFDATFGFKETGSGYRPPSGVKYPNVHVRLVGEDGNAYSIISRIREAMRKARVPQGEIDAYTAEAESGDFDKVIQTTTRWVNYDPPEPGSSFRM